MNDFAGKTVLVIEDEKDIRDSICEILKFEGYQVLSADNGAAGVDVMSRKKPDMILCDIMMPDLNGYEVLQKVKEIFPVSEIPFIYITALSERKDYRTAMNLGADDFLTKPFSVDELLNAVRVRLEKAQTAEKRIRERIDRIEETIHERSQELTNQIHQQKSEMNKISELNHLLGERLSEKELELSREALRVIDINNTLQNIEKMINSDLQRWDLNKQEKNTLEKLKSRINNRNLFVSNWSLFQMHFTKIHPNFITRLSDRFPGLTQMERTISCAIAINLTTDQLANMFNVQPESIRKSKYRLKLKMGLKPGQSLNDFIHKFKENP